MASSTSKEAYFVIEGRVQPKQRPRVFRNRYTGKTQTITPEKTVEYENKVRSAYIAEHGDRKFTGALQMTLNVYVKIPKGTSKKNREKMLIGEILPVTRTGDIDNLVKAVADALNGVAYDDDSQIVEATVRKFYLDEAKAEVTIRRKE